MNTSELRKWAEGHSIESKTIEGFWYNFSAYKNEQEEEFLELFGVDFGKNQLRVTTDSLALFIDDWNRDSYHSYGFDYVVCILSIVYKDEKVGEYKVLFSLDGNAFDDYFIIY